MKKYIITSLVIVLAVSFWNCEKDDICAQETPTTPRLIIEFYDAANPTELKNVTNLGIAEPTFETGYAFNAVSSITIPLRTNQDTTTLNFVLNGSDEDATNDLTDVVTFNYSRIETYISRACGYKTTFILNDTDGLVIPTSNWISSYEIVQTNINNEDETHVKIYF
ncbi:DUF6452 family protein [Flavobacterium ponti]|uniref:DUF6452 family protein n=1 Tax=Flavobacterium ponti TaxID=665133 RepID=A0ABV9P4Y2_9FLAO